MVKYAWVMTNDYGRETRWERYARSSSIMDKMMAEDSAIKAFIGTFGHDPFSVREVSV